MSVRQVFGSALLLAVVAVGVGSAPTVAAGVGAADTATVVTGHVRALPLDGDEWCYKHCG
jgi:hypothetical protein